MGGWEDLGTLAPSLKPFHPYVQSAMLLLREGGQWGEQTQTTRAGTGPGWVSGSTP